MARDLAAYSEQVTPILLDVGVPVVPDAVIHALKDVTVNVGAALKSDAVDSYDRHLLLHYFEALALVTVVAAVQAKVNLAKLRDTIKTFDALPTAEDRR